MPKTGHLHTNEFLCCTKSWHAVVKACAKLKCTTFANTKTQNSNAVSKHSTGHVTVHNTINEVQLNIKAEVRTEHCTESTDNVRNFCNNLELFVHIQCFTIINMPLILVTCFLISDDIQVVFVRKLNVHKRCYTVNGQALSLKQKIQCPAVVLLHVQALFITTKKLICLQTLSVILHQ